MEAVLFDPYKCLKPDDHSIIASFLAKPEITQKYKTTQFSEECYMILTKKGSRCIIVPNILTDGVTEFSVVYVEKDTVQIIPSNKVNAFIEELAYIQNY